MMANNFVDRLTEVLSVKTKQNGECVEWIGPYNKGGYGVLWFKRKYKMAHRISYERAFGEISDDVFVCHKCDNRRCINPKHLFIGDALVNYHDMFNKKRGPPNRLQLPSSKKNKKQFTSAYKGVYFDKETGKWAASIRTKPNKARRIGRYWSEKDAAKAYDAAAREKYGPDAVTNFPAAPDKQADGGGL